MPVKYLKSINIFLTNQKSSIYYSLSHYVSLSLCIHFNEALKLWDRRALEPEGADCQSTDLTWDGSGGVTAMSSLTTTQLLYEVLPNVTTRWCPCTNTQQTHKHMQRIPAWHKLRITKCQFILWDFALEKLNLFNVVWHLVKHLPKATYSVITVSLAQEAPVRFEPLTLEAVHIIC